MTTIACWEFGDASDDGAVFDGLSAYADLVWGPRHHLAEGSLSFTFVQLGAGGPACLMSLDAAGPVGFTIAVDGQGALHLVHSDPEADTQMSTPAGFFAPGDTVSVVYSWAVDRPGGMQVVNLTRMETDPAGTFYLEVVEDGATFAAAGARSMLTVGAEGGDGSPSSFFCGVIGRTRLDNTIHAALDGVVQGTGGADVIDAGYLGDPEGDRIDAGDAILAGVGPDDDLVLAGAGNDRVLAGQGDDQVFGEAGNDQLRGGVGDDTLSGGTGNDVLFGDDGDDVLVTGPGQDVAFGGAGDDLFVGGAGHDVMFGGDDRDTFTGVGAGDVVDGDEGGSDFDLLDLTGSGPFRIRYTGQDQESGFVDFLDNDGDVTGTLRFREIERIVPCFTPGAMIATPDGERPVESLKAGDKVITRDNGIQEIAWIGERRLDWQTLRRNPHLKPILVRKGALGGGLPERDMQLSPNHRMLVANDRTSLYFEEREVLASAKHLVNNRGIHEVEAIGVSYIHFMFERHEVILSNGAWSESFQPGDYSLRGIGNSQRSEIFELFPDLKTSCGLAGYTSARRSLKRHEARLLVEKP